MNDLYEKLAAIQHDIWAHWQKYVHNHKLNKDLTLSLEDVEHWNLQIMTPYVDLTEKEKDSDREQVDKFWHLIQELEAKAKCTHHHRGISQYSPFQHAWKCDKCDHIKQDE